VNFTASSSIALSDEYDINQQSRERSMRGFERLLAEIIQRQNLEEPSTKNQWSDAYDVDFIAMMKADGTVSFFSAQNTRSLRDFRKRSSRGARLRSETKRHQSSKRWLETVRKYKFKRLCSLKKHMPINHAFLIAIGKQFAHFLATVSRRRYDFAYSNWVQFYDSLVRLSSKPGPRNLPRFSSTAEITDHKSV